MADEAVSRQRVSASVVPARDRFEFWEQSVAQRVYPLRLQPVDHRAQLREPPTFRADFVLLQAAGVRISGGVLGPVRSQTTAAQARQRSGDLVHIGLRTGGRMVLESRQGSQTFVDGDLVLQADDEPNTHTYLEQVPMVLLSIEAAQLSVPVEALRSQMLKPIAADPAVRSLLLGAVQVARHATPLLDAVGTSSYLTGVAELVVRTILGNQPDHSGTADTRRAQVQQVVRSRLADPHLSAAAVAEAVGVSVRRLHQLFAGGPTVAEQIRAARMELAASLLRDPAWAGTPVSVVARRCGFVDHSQFSRSFRRATGATPTAFRG